MLFVLRFMWTKLMHFSDITKYFEDKTGQRTKRGGSAMQNYENGAVRYVKEKNGRYRSVKTKNGMAPLCKSKKMGRYRCIKIKKNGAAPLCKFSN